MDDVVAHGSNPSEVIDPRWQAKRDAKKAARRDREAKDMPLTITSLMDAFTIILCFLLKTYGSDPINITQSAELRLPGSVAPPRGGPLPKGPRVAHASGGLGVFGYSST